MNDGIKLDSFQLNLAEQVLEQLETCGQSALEVMTSGGKSYIAAHIMNEYISNHRYSRILWIAPRSAINNVKNRLIKNLALRNNIIYIGYEEIARRNSFEYCCDLDRYTSEIYNLGDTGSVDISNISLIVLDECHKACAKKTFKNLSDLLDRLGNADRLVMSATPLRYDGSNTFSILAPKVKEPIKFDIGDAAVHDLLPKIVYVLANSNISDVDMKAVKKYEAIASKNKTAMVMYSRVVDVLKNYKFNIDRDFRELLKCNLNISNEKFISGERHIAFFNSIEMLQSMRELVESAFKYVYPNCRINILEYHSHRTDSENADVFRQFVVEDPEENRIDVMLSVDKATESIHPDNVKSVIIFRATKSIRVYLQQIGRGIMLKKYHPDDIVIIDLADNINMIGEVSSSGNIEVLGSGRRVELLKRTLADQFGYSNGLVAKIGSKTIEQCLDDLDAIKRVVNDDRTVENIVNIKRIYNKYLVDRKIRGATENIFIMLDNLKEEAELYGGSTNDEFDLRKIWKKDLESFIKFCDKTRVRFSRIQGEFWFNREKLSEYAISELEKLGHSAYLRAGNRETAEVYLGYIDYVADAISKYGSIENCQNNHAKHKIKELKLAYASGRLTDNIIVYANTKRLNLDTTDIMFICESDTEKEIIKVFRDVTKKLLSIREEVQCGKNISIEEWLSIKARFTIAIKIYESTDIGKMCIPSILSGYNDVLDMYKLDSDDIQSANKLLSILFKYDNNMEFSATDENYIFEHYEFDGVCEYARSILSYYNITFEQLVKRTEFSRIYNSALSGNTEDIQLVMQMYGKYTDKYRLDKLSDDGIQREISKFLDCPSEGFLISTIKSLCNESDIDKINSIILSVDNALSEGRLKQLDVAIASFREYDIDEAAKLMECTEGEIEAYRSNLAIVSPLNILVTRCSQSNNCALDIIKHVIKLKNLDSVYKDRLELLLKLCNS